MALSEKKIRARILEVIWAICPDAKKIYRNILTSDKSKWAGQFTHEVAGKIVTHGWIVRRAKLEKADDDHAFDRYTFDLMGFYGHNLGTSSENTEDRFQAILDRIADRFNDKDVENPVWEFAGDDGDGDEGDEDGENGKEKDSATTGSIGFTTIGLIRPESGLLHYGGGRLVVNIFRC